MLQHLINKGYNLLDQGQYKEALETFLDVYSTSNGMLHLDCLLGLAQSYVGLNELKKAENTYFQMIDLNENFSTSYYGLGTLYEEMNDVQKAITYYKKAIQIDPNYVEAHFFLGGIYDDLKEYDLAIYEYKKTIQLNPNHFYALLNLGSIYEELDQLDFALMYLLKAKSIKDEYIVYYNLGVVYKKRMEIELAISSYLKAIELNVYDYKVYLNLALIYKDIYSDLRQSIVYYSKGLLTNESAILYYNRGCCYALLHEEPLCIQDLTKAIEISPSIQTFMHEDEELKDILSKHKIV